MALPSLPSLILPQGGDLGVSLTEQCLAPHLGPLTCIPLQQAGVLPAAPSCCANAAFQFLWFSFLLVLTQGLWDLQRKGMGCKGLGVGSLLDPCVPFRLSHLPSPLALLLPYLKNWISHFTPKELEVRYTYLPHSLPCPPKPLQFPGSLLPPSIEDYVSFWVWKAWVPACSPRPFYLPPTPDC